MLAGRLEAQSLIRVVTISMPPRVLSPITPPVLAGAARDGQSISFYYGDKEVLRYGKLLVKDSDGKKLSARLSLEEDILSIIVDDNGRYPIYIDPLLTNPAWTAEGNQAYAEFGWSVASAGDVNGDGCDDVIVGAPAYDNGELDEGRAFVYYGSPCSWQCSIQFDSTYSFPPDTVTVDIYPGQTLDFDVHTYVGGGDGMWITACVWYEAPDGWTIELDSGVTWDWDDCVALECGYTYSYPGEIRITAPVDADTSDYVDVSVFVSYCTEETTPICDHGPLCTSDTTVCQLYVVGSPPVPLLALPMIIILVLVMILIAAVIMRSRAAARA